MTRISNPYSVLLGAAIAVALHSQAFAQSQLPSREEVNPPAPPAQPPKARANVDEKNAFTNGPCPLSESDVRVAVREVRFTAPGGGALLPELQQLLGGIATGSEEQPIRVICDLRDQANARLRRSRYVASVQIPPQRIDDGVLRLEVVSGHIVEVRVRGDAGPFEGLIKDRIEQLKQLNPLNAADAERILLLADDVPGLNVQLGLSPATSGGTPGDLIGELTVNFRQTALVANVQNYNSSLLGRETAYVRTDAYGLLGTADRSWLAVSSTFDLREQRIVQVGESLLLNGAGDRLTVTGTLADSRPDLKTIDLRTLSLIGNIEFDHQLKRSVNTNAEVSLGFEWAQQRTRVYSAGGSAPLNRDRISTLYARLGGDTRKLRFDGSTAFSLAGSLELRKGLGIFGANQTGKLNGGYGPTRFEGDARATVVRGQVSGTIGFGPIFELATTLRGQWANHALLNYDEFAIGNLTIGRGYDPGANTGDRAYAGAHEARANVAVSKDVQAQLYGFYDWVRLINLDKGSTEARRWMASVGGGVRVTVLNSIRLDLTYAHPLDPPLLTGINIKRSPDRVMFSLTSQIIPFGTRR
ncbi:MAG: ShlB/FhaC/HecB family hemolysin secretion/activation protein [Sphingomonadales bacterium]|nr:ShlB/FhaC/HecB family hemolysin secretion/activation protein [Sphingomonadales bacterium]